MGKPKESLPEGAVAIENFYGVYLLYCTNPKFKGSTYIGFTVDPNRRIKQHNIGKKAGGAWKTSNRGPWEMVLIVHGFLNDIAALKFEWAWVHPHKSRHLKGCVTRKMSKETTFMFTIRILAEMLSVGPWNRLPLTVHWLVPSFQQPFPAHRPPPFHMAISYGPIYSVKVSGESSSTESRSSLRNMCWICTEFDEEAEMIRCIRRNCLLVAHTVCLAKSFLSEEHNEVIPIQGSCPRCKSKILWGDLVRKKKGCYVYLESEDNDQF